MAIVTRLLVLALALLAVSGLRIHRGRPVRKHGMLGLPAVTKSLAASGDEEVKEKWLEQRLDHFDPTNTATWKQVTKRKCAISHLAINSFVHSFIEVLYQFQVL